MKRILINAITIKMGGGMVVLLNLIHQMSVLNANIQWIVLVDSSIHQKLSVNSNVTLMSFSWLKKSPLHFLGWHEWLLPSLISRLKIDLFFSKTNTLPLRKLACPTLLLIHNAGHFSKVFNQLFLKNKGLLHFCIWWMKSLRVIMSVKKATVITVQTQALADAISLRCKRPLEKIMTIPHGPGLAKGEMAIRKWRSSKPWRIGYITMLGIQKNFETLFLALKKLKESGQDFTLVLTLNVNDPTYASVKAWLVKYNLEGFIENHGELNHDKVRDLYQSLDVFVYPSLCESFGFTLVEAMYYGLPIIAAETTSNVEILGEKGLFFKVTDSDGLAKHFIELKDNAELYTELSKHSLQRSQLFTWEKTAIGLLSVMHRLMD